MTSILHIPSGEVATFVRINYKGLPIAYGTLYLFKLGKESNIVTTLGAKVKYLHRYIFRSETLQDDNIDMILATICNSTGFLRDEFEIING